MNRVINKNYAELLNKKLFILDMDGTFYLGNRIIDGSLEFIHKLEETGKKFLFFTNNSSKNPGFYIKKLAEMGLSLNDGSVVTSGDVTIKYLLEKYPGKGIYLLGTERLVESFTQSGIKLVEDKPDIVVLGFDTTLTYEKISKACTFIRNGAIFLATHPDLNCPVEEGYIPDCGAMCAMITASTGIKPKYLGKPHKETIEMIMLITGMSKEDIAFVGDRLYTDIAIGVNNNVTSILVLSGETRLDELEHSPIQPDFVFESLGELANFI
jgi:Predicted sugar phosphatases of the HAD superfamily